MNDEKTKNLDLAISQIEKQYGKGAIMRLGSRDVLVPVSVIPTGSICLDAALGVGGFPRGRVVEDLRPGIGRQDHADAARHRAGPEDGRPGGFHRRRARARSRLCAQAGRGRGQSSGLAARQWRAGPGDRRDADSHPAAWTSSWWTRSRRWCRAPNSKATWAMPQMGLQARLDVAGAAQAHRASFRSRAPA